MAKRALLVDDDAEFQTIATRLLVDLGFSVVSAFSVAEAREAVVARGTNEPFDLILCDVRMPQEHGVALIRELKEGSPEIPLFLFATAYSDQATVEDLIRNEADYIVVKPISRESLATALEKGERRRQDREFQRIMRGS